MRSPDPNVDVEDVRPEAEFSRFFEIEHRGQVRRAALMLGEVNVAEDVVHDAFAEVWQRWRVLTDPGSYLDRCVINGCRDAASGRARSRHRFERMIASHRESTEPIEVRPPSRRCGRSGSTSEECRTKNWSTTRASDVDDRLWAQMLGPVAIEPRRPEVGRTHIEVYLPSQVLVVFADNKAVLIAHISSGELDDQGKPALWCETITSDTDDAGQPLAEPATTDQCGNSKTLGGVFKVYRHVAGTLWSPLGGLYNPVFFNYSIAIHGADHVPREPVSHGAVRINRVVADVLTNLVHDGDAVYVWGHDGKQSEDYTGQESLLSPKLSFRQPPLHHHDVAMM